MSNPRPPGCIKRPALIFVNHVYTTKLQDNIGGYVSHIMLILHVRPANYPTIMVVALCHMQTRWTPLRHSGGLQVIMCYITQKPCIFPTQYILCILNDSQINDDYLIFPQRSRFTGNSSGQLRCVVGLQFPTFRSIVAPSFSVSSRNLFLLGLLDPEGEGSTSLQSIAPYDPKAKT